MQFNQIINAILGTNTNGQAIVVGDMHRRTLRKHLSMFTRSFSLRCRDWRSLWRTPAGMTPATAMCPSYAASRSQRVSRWMPGVVVVPGTVGDC